MKDARTTAAAMPVAIQAERRISGVPRWSWRVPFREMNCVQFGQLLGGHLMGFVVADEVQSFADARSVDVAAGLGRVLDDSGASFVVEIGVHSSGANGLCGHGHVEYGLAVSDIQPPREMRAREDRAASRWARV